jgi:glycosyltransferase involved in cell wall biosynthesis
MNVSVVSYQAVSILHGGPNTQLRNTVAHMPAQGVAAKLFDSWAPFRKEECDLFHVFAANIGTFHIAREIHALGIPLVVSPIVYSNHSAAFIKRARTVHRLAGRLGRGIWSDYGLTADICSWAAHVLPNSEAESRLLLEGYDVPAAKLHVIPNGVDERFAHGDPDLFKNKYGVSDFILNVGHIGHGRKNVLNLIRALATIDHPAVIIGRIIRGEYGDACVREAARHKHIVLIDGLDNNSEMLASAYAASRVFVLPSMFETPGIAALEAGLAGANVVITPHGGTREYFGTMADYVEPGSIDSIREGILASLQKPKSPWLKEHIRREFLWQAVAAKTAAVYRKILEHR